MRRSTKKHIRSGVRAILAVLTSTLILSLSYVCVICF